MESSEFLDNSPNTCEKTILPLGLCYNPSYTPWGLYGIISMSGPGQLSADTPHNAENIFKILDSVQYCPSPDICVRIPEPQFMELAAAMFFVVGYKWMRFIRLLFPAGGAPLR